MEWSINAPCSNSPCPAHCHPMFQLAISLVSEKIVIFLVIGCFYIMLVIFVIIGRFCTMLLPALEQIDCAHVACDSE